MMTSERPSDQLKVLINSAVMFGISGGNQTVAAWLRRLEALRLADRVVGVLESGFDDSLLGYVEQLAAWSAAAPTAGFLDALTGSRRCSGK